MHASGTGSMAGMNPSLLSLQNHLRGSLDLPGLSAAMLAGSQGTAGFPVHPAFQLQGYPFYPGNLLAALRPQHVTQHTRDNNNIRDHSKVREHSGSKSPGAKSFTIESILSDPKTDSPDESCASPEPDDRQSPSRMLRVTNPLARTVDCTQQRAQLTEAEMRSRRMERLELAGHPYSQHGLPHCPTALRYGSFHAGGRPDKKPGHMTGSAWKGKSKRVRTIFTPEQLERLEAEFERQQYMVGTERYYLAASLNLTEAQVKVWFQNRRIKWRKQNLEQQHAKIAHYELFNGEEETDSDAEAAERKLDEQFLEQPDIQCQSLIPDDSNKNSSFDSGVSVEGTKGQAASAELALVYMTSTSLRPSSPLLQTES